ncbi:hypothetical protein D3C87_1795260 [compost metagenome]
MLLQDQRIVLKNHVLAVCKDTDGCQAHQPPALNMLDGGHHRAPTLRQGCVLSFAEYGCVENHSARFNFRRVFVPFVTDYLTSGVFQRGHGFQPGLGATVRPVVQRVPAPIGFFGFELQVSHKLGIQGQDA